mmetsp:Transcript_32229/g.92763  ORF Transcript_32229/g.92763 Transcript_32229/m.92763 type:complete len:732 (-) Transcript_32229:62-2257(-)
MQPTFDQQVIAKLNVSIEEETQKGDAKIQEKERASKRIRMIMEGAVKKRLKLDGEVKMFGSFSNGFKTGNSDLDVVFLGAAGPDNTISVLGKLASLVPDLGFENVTKIFQANVPLVKFTDILSQMEVDFCINNELGVRNSQLLCAYCQYDDRVRQLGRLVKDWAKRHELVGTADGCLNSYAYMLLVIHFLQQMQPPVVPNLQALATEPVRVVDTKWGCEDYWDTKFVDDVQSLPPSANSMSLGELLMRFFHFFTHVFDWHAHAVCMRLNGPGVSVDKYTLCTAINEEQWYVEDPFDLKHNLAGKCTRAGRKRILDEMHKALAVMRNGGTWAQAAPAGQVDLFFLKCRASQGVTPQALLEEFKEFDLVKLHFSKSDDNGRRMGQAFLEFNSAAARRRAHTKNESYVADCQLQLHYTSQHSLAEAVGQSHFSSYEMSSYKMQQQLLAARQMPMLQQQQPPPPHPQHHSDMGRALAPLPYQDGEGMMMPCPAPQSLMASDANQYPFHFGMMQRPSRQQQVMPPHPSSPHHLGGQGHSWEGSAAAAALEIPQQPQQQEQQPQQHQQQVQASQRRSQGPLPERPAPRPAGLVSSGANAPRSDARTRATEGRAPVSQIRNAPLSRSMQPAAERGDALAHRLSADALAVDHWMKVPLAVDPPKNCPGLLTEEQHDTIQAFLRSWQPPKLASATTGVLEVTIQVEMKAPSPEEPSLRPEQWRAFRDVKAWCEANSMSSK